MALTITVDFIFWPPFSCGSAYAHYRFSLLCDTNVQQHLYLLITQPASIERCNDMAENSLHERTFQLKQGTVLSAHLHCSLDLGICIAHWLWTLRTNTIVVSKISFWNNLRKIACQGKHHRIPSNNICDIGCTFFQSLQNIKLFTHIAVF